MRLFTILTILCIHSLRGLGQDTLPKFQVINSKGRIFVAFYNPYPSALQVNIERSFDSTRNFSTLYALSDARPGTVTFTDVKAFNDHMFYRIFIQQSSGYAFTAAQKPVLALEPPPAVAKKAQIDISDAQAGGSPVEVIKKKEWEPSPHVFTDEYGNVKVELPPPGDHKYELKFYDEQETLIFQMSDIKELPLTIDKSNFLHAGWFNFEWYTDGVIQEKNKFLLSKDN